MKIHICRCEQCKGAKKKRRNRSLKNKVKRLINKKRRTNKNKHFTFYWA